jgi:hypothetical protein
VAHQSVSVPHGTVCSPRARGSHSRWRVGHPGRRQWLARKTTSHCYAGPLRWDLPLPSPRGLGRTAPSDSVRREFRAGTESLARATTTVIRALATSGYKYLARSSLTQTRGGQPLELPPPWVQAHAVGRGAQTDLWASSGPRECTHGFGRKDWTWVCPEMLIVVRLSPPVAPRRGQLHCPTMYGKTMDLKFTIASFSGRDFWDKVSRSRRLVWWGSSVAAVGVWRRRLC